MNGRTKNEECTPVENRKTTYNMESKHCDLVEKLKILYMTGEERSHLYGDKKIMNMMRNGTIALIWKSEEVCNE